MTRELELDELLRLGWAESRPSRRSHFEIDRCASRSERRAGLVAAWSVGRRSPQCRVYPK
jgi:hypothetical protein